MKWNHSEHISSRNESEFNTTLSLNSSHLEYKCGQGFRNGESADTVMVSLSSASILLLLITISIYNVLPSLRNIHGRCISNHLFCLMLFFICQLAEMFVEPLDTIMSSRDRIVSVCWAIGMASYLTSLWANFWLVGVNLDIVSTFTRKTNESKYEEARRYKFYKIWFWFTPIVLMIVVVALENLVPDTSIFSPNIGCMRCFFSVSEGYAIVIFYYSILGLLLFVNLTTFVIANVVLYSFHRKRDALGKNKGVNTITLVWRRMMLFLKLFCVTGTTWAINIGFWAFEYYTLEDHDKHLAARILECFNVSHGFCYFIVFVCQPGIFKQLKDLANISGTGPSNEKRNRMSKQYDTTKSTDLD